MSEARHPSAPCVQRTMPLRRPCADKRPPWGLAWAILSSCAAPPSDAAPLPPHASFQQPAALSARVDCEQFVEELRQRIHESGVPGAALSISIGDTLVCADGVGVKKAGGTEPVDARTQFRIGSVSKTFTAAAATQLAARRLVPLDAPIARFVSELQAPYDAGGVTLRRLLSHTAGVPDVLEWDCPTREGFVASWFGDHQPLAQWSPPGRLFNYSNLGYALAGLVLERAAGLPFRTLVAQTLLEPLQLEDTTFELNGPGADNRAVGHSEHTDTDFSTAACALADPPAYMWSTARDLARFAQALLGERPGIAPRARFQMRLPHVSTQAPPNVFYGLGLLTSVRSKTTLAWHAGGIPGYRSALVMVPAHSAAVTVLTNGDALDPMGAAFSIVETLFDVRAPSSSPAPPARGLDRYAGRYVYAADPAAYPPPIVDEVRIAKHGRDLSLHLPGDPTAYPMVQLVRDAWLVTIDGDAIPVTFWRDWRGQPEYIASRLGTFRRVLH